ncbi:MAG: polyhydroxyalkanoate depolymerase [Beijerinckiaceae bacterium]
MNRFSYHVYEMAHLALAPARALSDATRLFFKNPVNPWTHTHVGRNLAASAELFERMTRRYGKPAFGLSATSIADAIYDVEEQVVWERPYCRLVRFHRPAYTGPQQSKLLIVAPMSGHYATLLRGTVEAFLPHFDVYITDWTDARMVPLSVGRFELDDYIEYLIAICGTLKPEGCNVPLHTLGVCQPSVPLIAAVALMQEDADRSAPDSMTLMGGPIDTRRSPTAVNIVAQERGVAWFKRNCIVSVPFPYPGMGRDVYPGFLQLSGFMAMNLDRHVNAHLEMFNHLVQGDGDSAEKHREFYDEYLAVMDLDADYYLQTVERVFVQHALPKGELTYRGRLVNLGAITSTALMTVEGEKDDISGVGQTAAAHDLCPNIPESRKLHHLQAGVGHYGVFNGSRFRREIAPKILEFTKMAGE